MWLGDENYTVNKGDYKHYGNSVKYLLMFAINGRYQPGRL